MVSIKKKSKFDIRLTPVTGALLAFLIIYVVLLVAPLIWAFITSFKAQSDYRLNVLGLPEKWVWNYSYVIKNGVLLIGTTGKYATVPQMFGYTFLYALGCAFTNTLVPCITAYLCARFRYKFSKVVYNVVVVVMILPIVGSLPAEVQMARTLGFYDHIWGLWLMKANFLGMYFLVFHAAFRGIPMTYTEAAKIDGANNMAIMTKVILPLAKNTFATVMLINFITFWNDYQTPMIYMPTYPTIAQGVFVMAQSSMNGLATVPMRMTGTMIMLIPILIVFLVFQRRLLGNLTVGGIKG